MVQSRDEVSCRALVVHGAPSIAICFLAEVSSLVVEADPYLRRAGAKRRHRYIRTAKLSPASQPQRRRRGTSDRYRCRMPTPSLADDLMMLALHPAEPRNVLVHPGIRFALRTSEILEDILGGKRVPPEKELRKTIRKSFHTLQPWLDRLTAAGRSAPQYRGFIPRERRELLLDHAGRAAAQRRLYGGLPQTPSTTLPAREAMLAALVEVGCLMSWAVPPGQASEPWTAAATAVVREEVGIADLPPGTLFSIMRVMHDEIERDWD